MPSSGPGNMHAIQLVGSFGDEELFAREMNWRVLTVVGCQGWPRLGRLYRVRCMSIVLLERDTGVRCYHCFLISVLFTFFYVVRLLLRLLNCAMSSEWNANTDVGLLLDYCEWNSSRVAVHLRLYTRNSEQGCIPLYTRNSGTTHCPGPYQPICFLIYQSCSSIWFVLLVSLNSILFLCTQIESNLGVRNPCCSNELVFPLRTHVVDAIVKALV
jgi:hypothetical protein